MRASHQVYMRLISPLLKRSITGSGRLGDGGFNGFTEGFIFFLPRMA